LAWKNLSHHPAKSSQSAVSSYENCDEHGKLAEPLWYAGLGVLAHCEEGDRLGHEWSNGDPRYTEQETQERLDRAREFGPTTCAKFHGLNLEPCARCAHWQNITSPIQLGRDAERNNRAPPNERGEGTDKTSERDEGTNRAKTEEQQGKSQANSGASQNPFPLRWHGEQDSSVKRKWLVQNMIPETGVGLLSGQWGTYKTFIAIDLAGAVMTGNLFAGRAVKRSGGVLFLAAEGAGEIPIRLSGLIDAKFAKHGKLPFAWRESCPTLMDRRAIEQLTRIAKEAADRMQSEFGVELVLIIVDTMSAAAGFTDENSSSEGQQAMNVCAELSRRTGAFLMACDHFGKAVETGTRGSSAKEGAADVVIACLGEKNLTGRIANTRVAIRKLRGGAGGAEIAYKLRIVDMGIDEGNEQITTGVIDWSPVTIGPVPETSKGKEWPRTATVLRGALLTTLEQRGTEMTPLADRPRVRAVELDAVRQEFDKCYPLDDGDRTKQMNRRRQAFKRSLETAQARGLVGCREIEGKFMVWLTNLEDGGTQPKSPPPGQR
jgi:AAA domain